MNEGRRLVTPNNEANLLLGGEAYQGKPCFFASLHVSQTGHESSLEVGNLEYTAETSGT